LKRKDEILESLTAKFNRFEQETARPQNNFKNNNRQN